MFTNAGKNLMLDALGGTLYVSAHTADPGESGANEVSGGGYSRQAINYSAAVAGAIDSSSIPEVPIGAGVTVTHVGYWTAATGGTFIAYSDIVDETFANGGNLRVNDSDLNLNG